MKISVVSTRSSHLWAIGSKMIASSEHRNYSHVCIKYVCPITDEIMIFQASKGLVNCFHIDNFLKDNIMVQEYTIPCTLDQFIAFYKFKCVNLGKKYSIKQILWFSLKKILGIHKWPKLIYNLIKNGDSEFICSEIATIVCIIMNVQMPKDIQLDQLSPSDLNKILADNKLELIIHG